MKSILTTCILAFYGSVFGQPTLEWVKTMGGTGNDKGNDIVVDNLGNTYTVGEFQNVVDFDPGAGVTALTSFGNIDVFVQKLDPNGNLLWVKQIGGTNTDNVASIVLDGNGDLIIAGEFKGTADFDPGVGISTLTATGIYYDTYILKLDSDGNLIWVKQLDATHHIFAVDLGINSANDVILTGRWFQTVDFDPGAGVSNLTAAGAGWDAYILKLASDGSFVWVKQITCTDNLYNQALAVDLSDNILLTGYYYATIDVDPGPGTVNYTSTLTQEDMFIVKLNNNGIYVWSENFTSPSTEMAYSIHVDSNNDYYFGGWFSSALDFDAGPGSAILTPAGGSNSDAFLLKLNSSGVFQWVNQMGGTSADEVWSVSSDSQGDILVAGIFNGTADLDPGISADNYTSAGIQDIFIQKVLSDGTYQWSLAIGGTGSDYVRSVAIGANDEIFSTGYFNLTSDFDPGAGVVSATSAGSGDIFVHKLSNCTPSAPIPDIASLSDLSGECSVSAPSPPTATNCSGTFDGTPDVSFPITTPGTTIVTWTYDDGNGNSTTQTQNVIINDVTPPTASNPAAMNVECTTDIPSPDVSVVTDEADNCSASSVVSFVSDASDGNTCPEVITRTYSVTDDNGNSINVTQTIIVMDVTDPVPDNASLSDLNGECGYTPAPPTATDNCSNSLTATPDVSFPLTTIGLNVITWTYTDDCNNTATQTQNVTITTPDISVTQNQETLTANGSGYTYQWVDCDNAYAPITGETNQTFTATINGNYAVVVDNGTCSDTSACYAVEGLGFDVLNNENPIAVYPNPTNGALVIDPGSYVQNVDISVITADGRTIKKQSFSETQKIEMTLEGAPGVYYIQLNSNGKTNIVRITKI